MDWTQVDIYTTTAGIEPVGAVLLELNVGGYAVRDAQDFEEFLQGKQGRWDIIDDEVMKLREAETALTVYLAQGEQGAQQLAMLRGELQRLKALDTEGRWGRLECALTGVREEDWATAWKRYYAPTPVGERLVICPSWEEDYAPPRGRTVVWMDPGMAFGTGTHESTRMCLELLQGLSLPGSRVLDLGCGSGILAISSLLLGAAEATLVDIDEVAVRVARENAGRNGVEDRCAFVCGDLAGAVKGPFSLIFANIIADVILSFLPDVQRLLAPGGRLIASGIIDTREPDILRGLEAHGLRVCRDRRDAGWVALEAGLQA